GLNFVRRNPVIVSLLSLDVGQTLFGSYRALLPIIADNLGAGAVGYGVLSAAPGVGSIVGSFAIVLQGDMRYKGLYTLFGVLAYCVALMLLAVSPWISLALVASALLGTMNSVQMIPRNSAIIAISPDALRGRVEAFRSMLAGGAPPLGYMFSGALAAAIGPSLALVGGGLLCAGCVAAIGLIRKELRDPNLGSMPASSTDFVTVGQADSITGR
ncbi:MAG: MFS transporter, partial [Thermomicrobiales bacterium]